MSKGMSQKVAVAQALLPGAGLLVLDEAWTGLDAPAKAALDEAVAERLADGGSVVFVDHEPGRLAQLDAERWRLDDAHASRLTGDAGPDADKSGAEVGNAGEQADVLRGGGQRPEPEDAQGSRSAGTSCRCCSGHTGGSRLPCCSPSGYSAAAAPGCRRGPGCGRRCAGPAPLRVAPR